jgi:hypothetical protein
LTTGSTAWIASFGTAIGIRERLVALAARRPA